MLELSRNVARGYIENLVFKLPTAVRPWILRLMRTAALVLKS